MRHEMRPREYNLLLNPKRFQGTVPACAVPGAKRSPCKTYLLSRTLDRTSPINLAQKPEEK